MPWRTVRSKTGDRPRFSRSHQKPWSVPGLSSFAFFAPEAERLLGRAVGITEEHALGRGAQPVRLPRGHDEDVVRRELERRFADRDPAAALDHAEDGAVGAAVSAAREPGGQPLHKD